MTNHTMSKPRNSLEAGWSMATLWVEHDFSRKQHKKSLKIWNFQD